MGPAKASYILRTVKVHHKQSCRFSYLCGTKVVGTNANRTVYVEFHSSSPPQPPTPLEAASTPSSNPVSRSLPGSSRPAEKYGLAELAVVEGSVRCRGNMQLRSEEGGFCRCSDRDCSLLGGSSKRYLRGHKSWIYGQFEPRVKIRTFAAFSALNETGTFSNVGAYLHAGRGSRGRHGNISYNQNANANAGRARGAKPAYKCRRHFSSQYRSSWVNASYVSGEYGESLPGTEYSVQRHQQPNTVET